MKAIVVGAGFGGLTAAHALRHVGVDVALFERASDLEKVAVGSGITFWSNAGRVFAEMGMLERLEEAGAVAEWSEFWSWRSGPIARWPIGEFGREFGASSVSGRRGDLHRALSGALEDGFVQLDHEYAGYEEDGSGITVRFENGHEERGDVLIAADGKDSHVRPDLIGPRKLRYAGYVSWNAPITFDHEEIPPGLVRNIYGGRNRFYYHNVGYGRKTWVSVARVAEGKQVEGPGVKQYLLDDFEGWPEPVQAMIDAAEEREIRALPIYYLPPLRKWGRGRATLLGDAAHAMTFDTGQGACQAIEDAAVLARHLSENGDPVAALRAYEAERVDRAALVTNRSRRMGRTALPGNTLAGIARDKMLKRMLPIMYRKHYTEVLNYDAWAGVTRDVETPAAPA